MMPVPAASASWRTFPNAATLAYGPHYRPAARHHGDGRFYRRTPADTKKDRSS